MCCSRSISSIIIGHLFVRLVPKSDKSKETAIMRGSPRLYLGNLDAAGDWGYARDAAGCRGRWRQRHIVAQPVHDMPMSGNDMAGLLRRQCPPPAIGLALTEEAGGVSGAFN